MIKITLSCPHCLSTNIKKNGKKYNSKQNYYCHFCKKQFIARHSLTYKAYQTGLVNKIKKMLVRGLGIRDIAEIEEVSTHKVLSVLVNFKEKIKPKKNFYEELEVDEFWSYVDNKKNKVWLIYAYDRQTGERRSPHEVNRCLGFWQTRFKNSKKTKKEITALKCSLSKNLYG